MARDIKSTMWKLGPGCEQLPDWAQSHVGKDIHHCDGFLTVHTPSGPVRLDDGDFLLTVPGAGRLFYLTDGEVKAGLEARSKLPLHPIGSAEAR